MCTHVALPVDLLGANGTGLREVPVAQWSSGQHDGIGKGAGLGVTIWHVHAPTGA